MKKIQYTMKASAVLVALLMSVSFVNAQEQEEAAPETTTEETGKDLRPIKNTFESGYLINSMTNVIPTAKTLECIIQHRFGNLQTETFDLLGMYAPSNIRIGLNYSFTDRIWVGIGTTKNNKLQDIQYKVGILKQTRSEAMPISLTYFGNTALDTRSDVYPRFTNRLSFFHQLIISRKVSERLSLQIAPSVFQFNMVDSANYNTNFALSFNGRFKFTDVSSIIFEYDQLLTKQKTDAAQPKPNFSLGYETATSAHAFQIFLTASNAIINQHNILYNKNDFSKKDMLIGFNITRLWNF